MKAIKYNLIKPAVAAALLCTAVRPLTGLCNSLFTKSLKPVERDWCYPMMVPR